MMDLFAGIMWYMENMDEDPKTDENVEGKSDDEDEDGTYILEQYTGLPEAQSQEKYTANLLKQLAKIGE